MRTRVYSTFSKKNLLATVPTVAVVLEAIFGEANSLCLLDEAYEEKILENHGLRDRQPADPRNASYLQ